MISLSSDHLPIHTDAVSLCVHLNRRQAPRRDQRARVEPEQEVRCGGGARRGGRACASRDLRRDDAQAAQGSAAGQFGAELERDCIDELLSGFEGSAHSRRRARLVARLLALAKAQAQAAAQADEQHVPGAPGGPGPGPGHGPKRCKNLEN